MLETPALGAETTRYGLKLVLLMGEPPPPLSTKVDTDVIHDIKYTRPSPPYLPTASDQKLDRGKAWE